MYDLIIVGGGPAGTAAGVYAARKRLNTLFITSDFGGQSTDSLDVQNWIGTPSISGINLGKAFKEHLEVYKDGVLNILEGQHVESLSKEADGSVLLTTQDGAHHRGKSVLLATGSNRKKLEVPGAEEFENKGITYCASCDAPMFSGADVVVVGGGNAAFESAAQLLEYARSVTLLNRSDKFKADPVTVEKVLSHENMTALKNAEITEVSGEQFVKGVSYKDKVSDTIKELSVGGVFVEIGLLPATDYVKGVLDMTKYNQIVVDPKNQRTTLPGVWAAGDCTDGLYHQNNIAAGDGVKALEDIYLSLKAGK